MCELLLASSHKAGVMCHNTRDDVKNSEGTGGETHREKKKEHKTVATLATVFFSARRPVVAATSLHLQPYASWPPARVLDAEFEAPELREIWNTSIQGKVCEQALPQQHCSTSPGICSTQVPISLGMQLK